MVAMRGWREQREWGRDVILFQVKSLGIKENTKRKMKEYKRKEKEKTK